MKDYTKIAKYFFKQHGAIILTSLEIAGIAASMVVSARSAVKASKRLEERKAAKREPLTKMEVAKIAIPTYAPAVALGVTTAGVAVGSALLNKRTQAGLASAYALLDQGYKEYKKKVEELYGEDATKKVMTEIAKEKATDENRPSELDPKVQRYYDDYSGRYFYSTRECILEAQIFANKTLNDFGYLSLNEFYDFLGIEGVDGGDEIGWSITELFDCCWTSWLEINEYGAVDDEELGGKCTLIHYPEPSTDWLNW